MFSLLLAIAGGITPIITSSSDVKLESIKKLSPDTILGYNYRKSPDQAAEVNRLTNGKGVDVVVNNTGPASIPADIASLRSRHGSIAVVGFLGGVTADWNPGVLLTLIAKTASIRYVIICPCYPEVISPKAKNFFLFLFPQQGHRCRLKTRLSSSKQVHRGQGNLPSAFDRPRL
jgi:NADPH:quinone reductase-like Zn-dependent oxidoreductase